MDKDTVEIWTSYGALAAVWTWTAAAVSVIAFLCWLVSII